MEHFILKYFQKRNIFILNYIGKGTFYLNVLKDYFLRGKAKKNSIHVFSLMKTKK
jgi:hypothetical protein